MKRHKTAERVEQSQFITRICVQAGCKFKGKPAQQGVCHSSTGELTDWDKLDKYNAEVVEELRRLRKAEGSGYILALEAHYISAMVNSDLILDECIRLRRNLALATVGRKARK